MYIKELTIATSPKTIRRNIRELIASEAILKIQLSALSNGLSFRLKVNAMTANDELSYMVYISEQPFNLGDPHRINTPHCSHETKITQIWDDCDIALNYINNRRGK